MNVYAWSVCALVFFDLVVLFTFFAVILRHPAMDRNARLTTALALSGFVVPAVLFYNGAVLYVQLATLAIIYIALSFGPFKRPWTGP